MYDGLRWIDGFSEERKTEFQKFTANTMMRITEFSDEQGFK